jgi:hypothetical protein
MERYKITYRKEIGFFSGTEWICYIEDRKNGKEYSGWGNTKKEAKDKAMDDVWYSNYDDTTENPSNSGSKEKSGSSIIYVLFGAILAILLSLFYQSNDKIKQNEDSFSPNMNGEIYNASQEEENYNKSFKEESITKIPKFYDTDDDGVKDELDKCPNEKGEVRYHGCQVPDTDGDGINDEIDKCVRDSGVARYDGCPIPDSDNDGVNDEEDVCINVYGKSENKGCP